MKKNIVVALAFALLVSVTHSAFADILHRDSVLAHSTDLYVYDENGNQVAADDDLTDECFVSWVPRWTGVFTIRIVNRGSVYNRYRLTTNGQ
jgi:hypothetical protein